jgi:hypothetical protein
MRTHRTIAALSLAVIPLLVGSACGTRDPSDRQAVAADAGTSGARRTASSPQTSTLGLTQMYGAFWAAYVPVESPTLGVTEMNGAFWVP